MYDTSLDQTMNRMNSNSEVWVFETPYYYAVQSGSNFQVCGLNPSVWPFKWKLLSSTFIMHFKLLFQVEILKELKAS